MLRELAAQNFNSVQHRRFVQFCEKLSPVVGKFYVSCLSCYKQDSFGNLFADFGKNVDYSVESLGWPKIPAQEDDFLAFKVEFLLGIKDGRCFTNPVFNNVYFVCGFIHFAEVSEKSVALIVFMHYYRVAFINEMLEQQLFVILEFLIYRVQSENNWQPGKAISQDQIDNFNSSLRAIQPVLVLDVYQIRSHADRSIEHVTGKGCGIIFKDREYSVALCAGLAHNKCFVADFSQRRIQVLSICSDSAFYRRISRHESYSHVRSPFPTLF